MAEEKTYVFGDGSNASVPAWLAYGNNNGGFGNGFGGWGGGILGFFLGLLFGNGGFGNWGGGFGGGRGLGYVANQLNNDNNTDLLMNAITSNGEASRSAIQNLATSLGQDFNLVNSAVQTLQSSLSTLAMQQAVSVPQIINSIQSGNASLASQLCECCCNMRQLAVEQGYQNQIRTLEQTNTLGTQAERNTRSITDAIAAQSTMITKEFCDVKERELQNKIDTQAEIITQLRGQIDNANQTAAITGYVNSVVAPLQSKVVEIANKMPNTVPVQYPNLVAVNATPYVSGGYYPSYPQYGYGNNGLIF